MKKEQDDYKVIISKKEWENQKIRENPWTKSSFVKEPEFSLNYNSKGK